MLASRTEKDAVIGTLLFNVMHYALRPWPWIIVALASTLIFPQLSDIAPRLPASRSAPHRQRHRLSRDAALPADALHRADDRGHARGVPLDHRDPSQLGHLVPGARFLPALVRTDATEKHYVRTGRLVTAGLMIVAAFTTYALGTAKEAFDLILSVGAGTGLLYLLRWFWWRVSAWSEIAAMISSFLVAVGFFVAAKMGRTFPRTSRSSRR